MATKAQQNATVEVKVPIHVWLIKRAKYDPGLRSTLERELGRQAMAVAREIAK